MAAYHSFVTSHLLCNCGERVEKSNTPRTIFENYFLILGNICIHNVIIWHHIHPIVAQCLWTKHLCWLSDSAPSCCWPRNSYCNSHKELKLLFSHQCSCTDWIIKIRRDNMSSLMCVTSPKRTSPTANVGLHKQWHHCVSIYSQACGLMWSHWIVVLVTFPGYCFLVAQNSEIQKGGNSLRKHSFLTRGPKHRLFGSFIYLSFFITVKKEEYEHWLI